MAVVSREVVSLAVVSRAVASIFLEVAVAWVSLLGKSGRRTRSRVERGHAVEYKGGHAIAG